MLINMKELLKKADEKGFAVPAFNIGSEAILKGVTESANETNTPVILAIHPTEHDYLGDSFISTCILEAQKTKVPMVIHLDHGGKFEEVLRAIRCGFTSVMIDASHMSYDENVKITQKVVEVSHPLNVSVEAELGTIGNTGTSYEGGANDIIYTNPDEAKDFVNKTGIDTLAVAIGTAHGLYPKNMKPELKLDLLKEIRDKVNIPLVLHGGSGNPDSEIAESVKIGISKINISSDIKHAFYTECRKVLADNPNWIEPNAIYPPCIKEMKKVIEFKMNLFGALGKADLY